MLQGCWNRDWSKNFFPFSVMLMALVLMFQVEGARSGLVSRNVVGPPGGLSELCKGTMVVGTGCCSGKDQSLVIDAASSSDGGTV